VDNCNNITNSQNRVRKKSFGGTFCFSNCHIIRLDTGGLVFLVSGLAMLFGPAFVSFRDQKRAPKLQGCVIVALQSCVIVALQGTSFTCLHRCVALLRYMYVVVILD
jgi:hypothetical protein